MARLEAVSKALYYPTPNAIAENLATLFKLNNYYFNKSEDPRHAGKMVYRLLDPCAGTGEALKRFANALPKKVNRSYGGEEYDTLFRLYGVELDVDRASEADHRGLKTLQGPFEDLITSVGGFDLIFCNPPYDEGENQRQEIEFLHRCNSLLQGHGVLIFIVPKKIIADKEVAKFLNSWYSTRVCLSFPEGEVESFNQCVFVGQRNTYASYYATDTIDIESWPADNVLFYGRHDKVEISNFSIATHQSIPFELMDRVTVPPSFEKRNGAYGSPRFSLLLRSTTEVICEPLIKPRAGHQAMLLAAGAMDGQQIGNTLVKGKAFKYESKTSTDEEEISTETLNTEISALSLESPYTLDKWNVKDNQDKTRQWFVDNQGEIAAALDRSFVPAFDGDLTPWEAKLAKVTAPRILPGQKDAHLIPIQKTVACAIAHRWRHNKSALLSGEMGTGKTLMSIAASEIAGHKKTVVICPTHLTKKWVSEVRSATGLSHIAMIGKSISDVNRFFASKTYRYLIISKETAKLGTRWRACRTVKTLKGKRYSKHYDYSVSREVTVEKEVLFKVMQCPKCGSKEPINSAEGFTIETLEAEKMKLKCHHCKEPLWQVTPLSAKGTVRWPLANIIANSYARRYSLLVDECHQYANAESDQSRAITKLCVSSNKFLIMTGTLYGGRASSLFQTLHRVDDSFRSLYKYDEQGKFSAAFGFFEARTKIEQKTSKYGYKKGGERIKEIPGVDPHMVPIMLPYSVFVKLKDLEMDLPPYHEHIVKVDQYDDIQSAYKTFQSSIQQALREYPQALGGYLQACLGWLDRPDQDETIMVTDKDTEESFVLAEVQGIEYDYYPKDEAAIDLCIETINDGGKAIIFMTQTHRRDARTRLCNLLREQGINAQILGNNISPENRMEWVDKQLDNGMQVMITNGKLVETGLDLIFANTIIQYGTEYSVHTLRQSVRRSWRLGQMKPVNVYYMAYRDTMQEVALNLISRKMLAAEAIDGDDVGELGQSSRSYNDFFVELAQMAIQGRDFSGTRFFMAQESPSDPNDPDDDDGDEEDDDD